MKKWDKSQMQNQIVINEEKQDYQAFNEVMLKEKVVKVSEKSIVRQGGKLDQ